MDSYFDKCPKVPPIKHMHEYNQQNQATAYFTLFIGILFGQTFLRKDLIIFQLKHVKGFHSQ